ncbi:MAG: 4'-phosphopantetheinyl transferase superfamily protein [Candidatus Promineifilaceae bacterium]
MLYTLVIDRNDTPELIGDTPPDGLLTTEETTVYQTLKTEKRRRDWLHGRYTAKHLIQRVFQKERNLHLDYHDFAVLRKENGAPAVTWFDGIGRPPVTLSISHTSGVAFCALRLDEAGYLGCDVEQTAPRSALFIADYFTPAEQDLVEQTPASQRDILINAIWSGKESALKALELGLQVDTRAVTCLPETGREPYRQPLIITLDLARISDPVQTFAGRWQALGQFVFTVVAPTAVLATDTTWEMENWIHDKTDG